MPIIQNRGLRGLPGLNNISDKERESFMLANASVLNKYRNPGNKKRAAEILYNNQQFINQFGKEAFDKLNVDSEEAYNLRNNMLREKVVNDAFEAAFKPRIVNGRIDESTGAGSQWNRLQELPTDARERLLKSEWLTPAEFEKESDHSGWRNALKTGASIFNAVTSIPTFLTKELFGGDVKKYLNALDMRENVVDMVMEGWKQYDKEKNDKILDTIYNDAADTAASKYASQVAQAYLDPEITGRDDMDTKQKFLKEITPNSYDGNMGISEYAAHFGTGSEDDLDRGDMDEFSIDDMRKVLAKKYVYERTMSRPMANTALNNEAKRYIKDHQSGFEELGMFGKDVGIAAMSYTADKINSIYNLVLAAQDNTSSLPTVWVSDKGEVVDTTKHPLKNGGNGQVVYTDKEGTDHVVHREQIDRRTLHNMGKNEDGTDAAEGIFHLNPQYWTRAEQFGTLDAEEQKQYEKLGSSPYKVMYDPNDDRDLVYESFKMMSFGLADAASQLIPFGIGMTGRVLSTAGNVGRVVRGFGKGLDVAGKYLTAQTKVGQVAQGLLGAGGIGYAYQRGAFQETLAQNMANLEEANMHKAQNDIYSQYENDENFKANVDSLIADRVSKIAPDYIARLKESGQLENMDAETLQQTIVNTAKEAVLGELVGHQAEANKNTKEYANMQQEAIQSAGDAAFRTFLPEAIKYGLVNTIGYRKFLYTNPMGLKKPISAAYKGMKEVTTKDGLKRLTTESALEGAKGKAKSLGKVVGSQFWGGAWTNGTDDMMTDAAERINEDSFKRYLNAYENGDALATEYGLIDGIYSYWKGLGNSLGQKTTWDAAAVGGFGSLVSASPNMVNMVHLLTKEGKEEFNKQFGKRNVYETDENGFNKVKTDEKGNPVTEDVGWRDNFLEMASFFWQNGVLNNYYAKKQQEKAVQEHADYINAILDRNEDFSVIKDLIASDMERENISFEGNWRKNEHTMRFVQALNSIRTLEALREDKKDLATLSSVVDDALRIIDNASKIGTEESPLSVNQMNEMIKTYYKFNPGLGESEEHNRQAIEHIAKNAQKLVEAYDAYNEAEKHVASLEKENGTPFRNNVKSAIILNKALNGHWEDRIKTMQDEIGDVATAQQEADGETLIAVSGGVKGVNARIANYDNIEQAFLIDPNDRTQTLEATVRYENEMLAEYKKAQEKYNKATTSDDKYAALQELRAAQVLYEDAVESRDRAEKGLERVRLNRGKLKKALAEHGEEPVKVLTADEIFALNVHDRAFMMHPNNRKLYSAAQRSEIEKLEERLKREYSTTGDPLQKIQDISDLTYSIEQNKDAYNRITRNPDAAALRFDKMREAEAKKAYDVINKRNAATLAEAVRSIEDGLKIHLNDKDDSGNPITEERINDTLYRILRRHNPRLLNIIEKEKMLPTHGAEISKAKEWGNIVGDISAVVDSLDLSQEEKSKLGNDIDYVISNASTKEEVVDRLESAIKAGHTNADNIEKVLNGLDTLKYQKAAVAIENVQKEKARRAAELEKIKERERAIKKKEEEEAARLARKRKEKEEKKAKKSGSEDEGEEVVLGPAKDPDSAIIDADSFEDLDIDTQVELYKRYLLSDNHRKRLTKEQKSALAAFKAALEKDAASEDSEDYVSEVQSRFRDAWQAAEAQFKIEKKALGSAVDAGKNTGDEAPDNNPNNLKGGHDDAIGDYVYLDGVSAVEEAQKSGSDTIEVSDAEVMDLDEENAKSETEDSTEEEDEFVTLTATPMIPWIIKAEKDANGDWKFMGDGRSLSKDGELVHKRGKNPEDSMNRFYRWLEAEKINLQDIIDDELAQIISQWTKDKKGPLPVKFMVVRPGSSTGRTHDLDVHNNQTNHLFLVIDYDSSVKKVHKKYNDGGNGGVIKSKGKEYLIIGTLGYGKSRDGKKFQLWKRLNDGNREGSVTNSAWVNFFSKKGNEAERFYVHEGFHTEIVPSTLIPGWVVNKLESDEESGKIRPISELMRDETRNPHKLTFSNMAWSIVERKKKVSINLKGREAMPIRNHDANVGRVFALVPAGNGKLFPVKIEPLHYMEERYNAQSALHQEIQRSLMKLVSTNPDPDVTRNNRLEALGELFNVFLMGKERTHNILIGEDNNGITLVRNDEDGVEEYKKTIYTKDNPNPFAELEAAVRDWDPRINITPRVLDNIETIKKFDEIGALSVDVAKLGLSGVEYSVYAINDNGEMIKPENPAWTAPVTTYDGDYANEHKRDVYYTDGTKYQYDIDSGEYSLEGKKVENEALIAELDYARRIVDGGRMPAKKAGRWSYYILDSGDKVEVVRQDTGTNKVKKLSDEQAAKIIKEVEEKRAAEARDEENKKKLGEGQEKGTKLEDLISGNVGETGEVTGKEAGEAGETDTDDSDTYGYVNPDEGDAVVLNETPTSEKPKPKPKTPSPAPKSAGGTQSISKALRQPNMRGKITSAIASKWKSENIPSSPAKVAEFLKEKGVPQDALDNIPTDPKKLKAWVHTYIECL